MHRFTLPTLKFSLPSLCHPPPKKHQQQQQHWCWCHHCYQTMETGNQEDQTVLKYIDMLMQDTGLEVSDIETAMQDRKVWRIIVDWGHFLDLKHKKHVLPTLQYPCKCYLVVLCPHICHSVWYIPYCSLYRRQQQRSCSGDGKKEHNHCIVLSCTRGDFKTQPPVDRWFHLVSGGCHCLEQWKPAGTW